MSRPPASRAGPRGEIKGLVHSMSPSPAVELSTAQAATGENHGATYRGREPDVEHPPQLLAELVGRHVLSLATSMDAQGSTGFRTMRHVVDKLTATGRAG